jgi:hypothetical protein
MRVVEGEIAHLVRYTNGAGKCEVIEVDPLDCNSRSSGAMERKKVA